MTKYQMLIEILATTSTKHYSSGKGIYEEELNLVNHIEKIMEYDDGGGWNAPPDKNWFQDEGETSKKLHKIMKDLKDARQEYADNFDPY